MVQNHARIVPKTQIRRLGAIRLLPALATLVISYLHRAYARYARQENMCFLNMGIHVRGVQVENILLQVPIHARIVWQENILRMVIHYARIVRQENILLQIRNHARLVRQEHILLQVIHRARIAM
jgi:hypothetical protein